MATHSKVKYCHLVNAIEQMPIPFSSYESLMQKTQPISSSVDMLTAEPSMPHLSKVMNFPRMVNNHLVLDHWGYSGFRQVPNLLHAPTATTNTISDRSKVTERMQVICTPVYKYDTPLVCVPALCETVAFHREDKVPLVPYNSSTELSTNSVAVSVIKVPKLAPIPMSYPKLTDDIGKNQDTSFSQAVADGTESFSYGYSAYYPSTENPRVLSLKTSHVHQSPQNAKKSRDYSNAKLLDAEKVHKSTFDFPDAYSILPQATNEQDKINHCHLQTDQGNCLNCCRTQSRKMIPITKSQTNSLVPMNKSESISLSGHETLREWSERKTYLGHPSRCYRRQFMPYPTQKLRRIENRCSYEGNYHVKYPYCPEKTLITDPWQNGMDPPYQIRKEEPDIIEEAPWQVMKNGDIRNHFHQGNIDQKRIYWPELYYAKNNTEKPTKGLHEVNQEFTAFQVMKCSFERHHANDREGHEVTGSHDLSGTATIKDERKRKRRKANTCIPFALHSATGHISKRLPGEHRKTTKTFPALRFASKQTKALESYFAISHYVSKEERMAIANDLQIEEKQVLTWFQNKRAKLKRLQVRQGKRRMPRSD